MADSPPQVSPEMLRVLGLPRRTWDDELELSQVVLGMTNMLKTPAGTMTLRPLQAIALFEMATEGGAFIPLAVAGGKTIISLCAATVLSAKRPLLVVPAKLVDKTKRDWRELDYHWRIYPGLRVVSFTLLTLTQGAKLLEDYQPDLIILDESQKAKDHTKSAARRLERYLKSRPETKVVAMTGSHTMRSIFDYAHIVRWSLGPLRSPVPTHYTDLEAWSGVLDEKSGSWRKDGEDDPPDPGALVYLCNEAERAQGLPGVRRAYARRFVETRGIIASKDSGTGIPIIIDRTTPDIPADVREALNYMRSTWKTPDEQPFLDAVALWRHCREVALGFYYRWTPPPPEPWIEARKLWAAWSRYIIQNGRRHCDTELQVIHAVDEGHYPEAESALQAWRQIRDTYVPTTEPVWLSDYVIDHVIDLAQEGLPALIWTEHTAFAERLALKSGIPYYGREAKTSSGRSILDHPYTLPAICSIRSIGEGFNLQKFSRNIICSIPPNGPQWEQLLGRTDREGNKADEITCTVVVTCPEHESALQQARADAQYIQDTSGMQQKLLKADYV